MSTHAKRWAEKLLLDFSDSNIDALRLLSRIDNALRRLDGDNIRSALREGFAATVEGDVLRSDILVAVEGGEMRPSKAEAWAGIFGWRPFTGWADQASFDPMAEKYWTPAMVAAWIRWHDQTTPTETFIEQPLTEDELTAAAGYGIATDNLEIGESVIDWSAQDRARATNAIRRVSPGYIERSTRWIAVDDGHVPGSREDRGWSESPGESTDTKHRLVTALKNGLIVAEHYRDGKFIPIPQGDWSAFRIVGFHDDDGVLKVVAPDGRALDGVRITCKSVMGAFSPAFIDGTAPVPKRNMSEAELRKRVEQARRADRTIPSADEIENALRSECLAPDRKLLRAIVAELSGRTPGRPPKIRTPKSA